MHVCILYLSIGGKQLDKVIVGTLEGKVAHKELLAVAEAGHARAGLKCHFFSYVNKTGKKAKTSLVR